jgi:hypothetical protein
VSHLSGSANVPSVLGGRHGDAAYHAARDHYDRHRPAILRDALAGRGRFLDRARELRGDVVAERFGDVEAVARLVSLRERLRRRADDGCSELREAPPACWFERLGERVTVMLRRPGLMKRSLPRPATDVCLSLLGPAQRERAAEIFDRSDLRDDAPAYETFAREGLSCIRGVNAASFAGLSGIAHELGHCLQEERTGFGSFRAMVQSEAAAQSFEEVVVAAAAQRYAPDDVLDWHRYQQRVDVLALHLCELDTASALREPLPPLPFPESAAWLRASYATDPGFESVYAGASIARARVRGLWLPRPAVSEVLAEADGLLRTVSAVAAGEEIAS